MDIEEISIETNSINPSKIDEEKFVSGDCDKLSIDAVDSTHVRLMQFGHNVRN